MNIQTCGLIKCEDGVRDAPAGFLVSYSSLLFSGESHLEYHSLAGGCEDVSRSTAEV